MSTTMDRPEQPAKATSAKAPDETDQSESVQSWADKRIFTTGEAADVCKVSQQTIIRCFDSGRVSGFRVPGSKFRRIPRDELIRFMKANNIPTEILDAGKKRILAVDDDPAILELFMDLFKADGRFELRTAANGYDAGMLTEQFRPHLLLLDYLLPDINGTVVCQRIRNNSHLKSCKILFISGVIKADEVQSLKAAGADDFLKKPFEIQDLMSRIERLLGLGSREAPSPGASA
jgi:two-component system, OmpR family, response regulator